MRDFKYRDLVVERPEWTAAMKDLGQATPKCIEECSRAFAVNMMRVRAFCRLPGQMTFLAATGVAYEANAYMQVTGAPSFTIHDLLANQHSDDFFAAWVLEQAKFDQLPPDKRKQIEEACAIGMVERYLQTEHELTKSNWMKDASFDALLTSAVLESWLFFEALCSDLWTTAVDNGTSVIAGRVLATSKAWINSDENLKAIDAAQLRSDPKTQMGSYLREIGKVAFTKLRDIKKFYGLAFGDAVEKVFDSTADGRIKELSAVRNCIIHQAGKVDRTFKMGVQEFKEWSHLEIGDRIQLDGAIVGRLQNAAIMTGLALVKAVEAELAAK